MTELMEDISHPKALFGKEGLFFQRIHDLVELAGNYGFSRKISGTIISRSCW